MNSSANLINNLLLNLDNLKIQTENNEYNENVNNNLQEQLELLKSETEKITNQYTQTSNKKNKKLPPPIITGKYSKYQTIDDMLNELNKATYGSKNPKSNKGRKMSGMSGTFIDPRRFSDPYKYTVLSTLDETEDDEDNSNESTEYTPRTPKSTFSFYSRKNKEYNTNCNIINNRKLSISHLLSPNCGPSVSSRTRSYSQPEKYNNIYKNTIHEGEKRYSFNCLQRINESVENEKTYQRVNFDYIKPPRSSSIQNNRSLGKPIIEDSSSETSESSEQNYENEYYQYHVMGDIEYIKLKNPLGLESKSSFQSDKTLVNEE